MSDASAKEGELPSPTAESTRSGVGASTVAVVSTTVFDDPNPSDLGRDSVRALEKISFDAEGPAFALTEEPPVVTAAIKRSTSTGIATYRQTIHESEILYLTFILESASHGKRNGRRQHVAHDPVQAESSRHVETEEG